MAPREKEDKPIRPLATTLGPLYPLPLVAQVACRLVVCALLITAAGAPLMGAQAGSDHTTTIVNNAHVHVDGPATATPFDDPTKDDTTMNEDAPAGLEINPLADILPLMGEKEFEALVEDIRAHGLQERITVHQEKIVDGRNRYLACRKLGKVPDVVPWDGRGSLAAFVASKNVHRRHLSESQRAMFGGRLKDEFEKEARLNMSRGGQGLADLPTVHSRDRAAQAVNVSSRLVGSAEKVLKDGVPELAEAVKQGAVAVTAAAELAELPPDDQAEVVAQGPKAARAKAAAIRRAKSDREAPEAAPEPPRDTLVEITPRTPSIKDRDELPDKNWLKGLPLHSELPPRQRVKFVRAATYWVRLVELNETYFRSLKDLDDEFRAADPDFEGPCDRIVGSPDARELAGSLLYPLAPESWKACQECEGKRSRRDDDCIMCSGNGFIGVFD